MNGTLPPGWTKTTLGEIAEINPRHPANLRASLPVSFVPMPGVSETSSDFQFTEERQLGVVRKGYTHFAEGDVLFAKITPCMENGKAAVATQLRNGLGCGTTEIHILRPHDGVSSKYIYHYIHQQTFRHEAARNFTGTAGQLRVPVDFMRNADIPLAPSREQLRIVAELEILLAKVETSRQRIAKIHLILKRFRRAVLTAAFSGSLTADWRGSTVTGDDLPTGWELRRIDSLFTVRTGGTPSRKVPDYFTRGSIPWVKTGEVQNTDITTVEEYITRRAVEESNAKVFPTGTILIAMYGEGKTRGQIGRLTFPAATNQACAALINIDLPQETSRYVFLCLLSQYYKLRAEAVGGNQPNLNLGIIKEWEIPIPSTEEQAEIAKRVEALFKIADRIEKRYLDVKKQVDKLSDTILAKAFRGELVPQDPNDEPAEKFLERLRAREICLQQ